MSSEFISQLVLVLHGACNSDVHQMAQAEVMLKEAQRREGFCLSLLQICCKSDVDPAIRQAAAIYLKNAIRKRWNCKAVAGHEEAAADKAPICNEEKQFVKQNLHLSIVRSDPLINKQLLEVLRDVLLWEFPANWPTLVPELLNALSAPGEDISGSLQVLERLGSVVQLNDEGDARKNLSAAVFPVLIGILYRLLAALPTAPDTAKLIHSCLKFFWSCTFLMIPPVLHEQAELRTRWLEGIMEVLKATPPDGLPAEAAAREKTAYWKMSKWAMKLAYRLINRYGEPASCKREMDMAFAAVFQKDFAARYLEVVLMRAQRIGKGEWSGRQTTVMLCKFVYTAAKQKSTRGILRPYLLELLTHVALPLCYCTDAVVQEWVDDPAEVIRKNSSTLALLVEDDLYDPKDAALTLIVDIMRIAQLAEQLMGPFMAHVVGMADAFQREMEQNPGNPDRVICYHMDAAALALGALLTQGSAPRASGEQVQHVARSYVLPLVACPLPVLRAKGMWLAAQCAEMLDASGAGKSGKRRGGQKQVFDELFEVVLRGMRDEQMPVQVEAINSFRSFVEALAEAKRLEEKLKPILKDLLTLFFQLAVVIEAMDVIRTVDTIVENIGEDVQPFAVECCSELLRVYTKVVTENTDADEEVLFDAIYAILSPILKLLDACLLLPSTLSNLHSLLMPMIVDLFQRCPDDCCEQVCEILASFTYFLDPIPDDVWALWPTLEGFFFTDWGTFYTENLIVPMDNMISHGKDRFCSSKDPNYLESVLRIVKHALDPKHQELETRCAAKLLDIVLLQCTGRVDEWLWPCLELTLDRLQQGCTEALGTLLMNVVAAAMLYNCTQCLAHLQAHGRLMHVFERWFAMLQDDQRCFRRLYDKKLSCLALLTLLRMPELPDSLTSAPPAMLREVVKLLVRLKEQEFLLGSRKEGVPGQDTPTSDQALNGSGEFAEADDGLEIKGKSTRDMCGDSDGSSLVLDGDWTDDEDVETAIDNEDPFAALASTMDWAASQVPSRIEALTSGMDQQMQGTLQELMQFAQIRRADLSHAATK